MKNKVDDSVRDRPTEDKALVSEVARLLTEWEDSEELATIFAARLIFFVRERGREQTQSIDK